MEKKQKVKGTYFANALQNPKWDSKITSANTTKKELWLGYVLGPYGCLLLQSIVNSYYNQYLTDVLGFTAEKGVWIAAFMVAFPVVSKIIDSITNLIMCNILDKTVSRQGKLRPWLLFAIPVVVISVLLMFWVPVADPVAQAIWVVIAYNLFYAVGYTMWLMPTELSAPLSTRNMKQRSGLSMGFTITRNIGTGLVSILFPTILTSVCRAVNGNNAQGYLLCMAVICCIAVPCMLLQYFYTRERITEESRKTEKLKKEAGIDEKTEQTVSMWEQFKIAVTDKYWLILMLVLIFGELLANLRNISLVYYTGWVVKGNAYGEYASIQAKFQMIAMSPMGPGLVLLLPLLKKWGRRKCIWVGSTLTIVGSVIAFVCAGSSMMIYAGSALAAFGNIAFSYTVVTYLGDVIDHVEWKSGKRVEGITGGIRGIATCVGVGIAQGIFNLGLMLTGYATPEAIGTVEGITKYADQTAGATSWINFSYQGSYIIIGIMYFVVFLFLFDIEEKLPTLQKELQQRKIDECKALGIEYIAPDELERREIEQQEKEAEESRIKELKERCSKRGLDFDTENNKVLAKRAKKQEKIERKAKKDKK